MSECTPDPYLCMLILDTLKLVTFAMLGTSVAVTNASTLNAMTTIEVRIA